MRAKTALAFDAAHRILGHSGKCAHLHGHTYHLEVTVGAQQLNSLVMDFDDLKAGVKKAVVDRWDHATLLWQAISQSLPSHVVLERVLI
ncbi:MAG: 6-pyruvoyl trahydropterin synthase family protein, partial [Vicinamibacterales bacterium]